MMTIEKDALNRKKKVLEIAKDTEKTQTEQVNESLEKTKQLQDLKKKARDLKKSCQSSTSI